LEPSGKDSKLVDSTALIQMVETKVEDITAFIGESMPVDFFMQAAKQAVIKSPKLIECNPESFMNALMACARLKLIPDGQDCSLVPFYNKKQQGYVATFVLGYFGALKLCYRNDRIESIDASVVYQKDHFKYVKGTSPEIEHVGSAYAWKEEKGNENSNPITQAYCIVNLRNSNKPIIKVLQRWEIERIRDVSPAQSSGPWVQWFPEMAMKTAIKQAMKTAPKSDDLVKAYQIDEVKDAFNVESRFETLDQTDKQTSQSIIENKIIEEKTEEKVLQTAPETILGPESGGINFITEGTVDQINQILLLPTIDTVAVMTYMFNTYNVEEVKYLSEEQGIEYLTYLSKKVF